MYYLVFISSAKSLNFELLSINDWSNLFPSSGSDILIKYKDFFNINKSLWSLLLLFFSIKSKYFIILFLSVIKFFSKTLFNAKIE